ncbi:hypothetical protein [Dongia sp.]|uniref:hypothetical protein n=1 Tax=Dongia sp. TaxID=1977262 RepID=UPI0035B084CF
MHELCAASGDILALSAEDVAAAALRRGLKRTSRDLLGKLLAQAIDCDIHRLTDVFRMSGGTALQPARLVGD